MREEQLEPELEIEYRYPNGAPVLVRCMGNMPATIERRGPLGYVIRFDDGQTDWWYCDAEIDPAPGSTCGDASYHEFNVGPCELSSGHRGKHKCGDVAWPSTAFDEGIDGVGPSRIKGRADTEAKRREMLTRILAAWAMEPRLRLGQLLSNAGGMITVPPTTPDLFHLEDAVLLMKVEAFVRTIRMKVKL